MSAGKRVETGLVRFGDDWTGVFIRGDNAFALAGQLTTLLQAASNTPASTELEVARLGVLEFIKLLGASREEHGVAGREIRVIRNMAGESERIPGKVVGRRELARPVVLTSAERTSDDKEQTYTGTLERVIELAGMVAGKAPTGELRRNWSIPCLSDLVAAIAIALDEQARGTRYDQAAAQTLADQLCGRLGGAP